MNSIYKTLAVAAQFCLASLTVGCLADGPTADDEEHIGDVKEAWSYDAPQRGWVDNIQSQRGFGPLVADYNIWGWACLKPNGQAPSTALHVYQGSPGAGRLLDVVYPTSYNRYDTPCANLDNGFSVHVRNVDWTAPQVFYVSYEGTYPAITLEGTSSPP